jgi:BlaI family penicillinase repressor
MGVSRGNRNVKRKALDDLGELQRRILEVVWDLREASVHQVREILERRGKKRAYTTVLSVMQKLEKAGWLEHRAVGRRYLYRPVQSREEAGAGSVRGLLKRVFAGDALAMFQHLIRASNLSDEELRELRAMIEEKRKEGKP